MLNDIREEEKKRQAKVMSSMDHLMTSLNHHNEILKQSNETRMQEDRRQYNRRFEVLKMGENL